MRRYIIELSLVLGSIGWASTARADLCNEVKDGVVDITTVRDVDFYQQLFTDTRHHADRKYNEVILECNRDRDQNGNEVSGLLGTATSNTQKTTLLSANLDPKIIRGMYNFFGTVFTQQRYAYVLSKSNGVWTMVIPYDARFSELVPNRVDFYIGRRPVTNGATGTLGSTVTEGGLAWQLYDSSQVDYSVAPHRLVAGARPIAETLCSSSTYFPGSETAYAGQSGFDSSRRDKENRHISLGRIEYRYDSADDPNASPPTYGAVKLGCRVDKYVPLFRNNPSTGAFEGIMPQDAVLDNFERVTEEYWSRPADFELQLMLKDRNETSFSSRVQALIEDDDFLTVYFATKFMPYGGNQMYKSNPIQFNNFSTMTTNGTLLHEVGHAFGLDDEYSNDDSQTNSCEHPPYENLQSTPPDPDDYQMCDSSTDANVTTIYHYIAVSRYVTRQDECNQDSDCATGEWCDAGVNLVKNVCLPKRTNGQACPLAGGGHACVSGFCAYGTCYTPSSVAIGGACFVDAQCEAGHCSSVAGTNGQCVCSDDADCGSNAICQEGTLGIGLNRCAATRAPTCPVGWSYEIRNPLNRDQCTRVVTQTTALQCKLLITDNPDNWTGPHAILGEDECRSTKGKPPKGVKCPSGFTHTIRSGADTCTKTTTEQATPSCPSGFDYRSQTGRDLCVEE